MPYFFTYPLLLMVCAIPFVGFPLMNTFFVCSFQGASNQASISNSFADIKISEKDFRALQILRAENSTGIQKKYFDGPDAKILIYENTNRVSPSIKI